MPSLQWWDTPHLIIARIAYDDLKSSGKEQHVEKAEALLAELGKYTDLEQDHPFIEAATFGDDAKARGFGTQAPLHFINTAVVAEDFTGKVPDLPSYNVQYGLGEMQRSLKGARPGIGGHGIKFALGNSINMRLLIHYVGDAHQPMHAATLYSADHPKGDRGGTQYNVDASEHDIYTMHFLWDSACYKYEERISLPLDSESWDRIGTEAASLVSQYPKSDYDLTIDFKAWTDEGLKIAEDFVYTLPEGSKPSEEYINKCQDISSKQITAAGYRLS